MTEREFETWWNANRQTVLKQNKDYIERENSYKMKGIGDLIIFAIPVIAGVLFLDSGIVKHEMLNWVASAVVVIVCFLLCVFIKSRTIPGESLYDIEKRLKKEYWEKMKNEENDSSLARMKTTTDDAD